MNSNYERFLKDAGDQVSVQPVQDGIFTIHLHDWTLADGLFSTMRNMSHAIYRGVPSSEFDLMPSLFRKPSRSVVLQGSGGSVSQDVLQRYINHFRLAIRGRRGANPKDLGIYETWALGRHYGLRTPLLDWTTSPYVAVFFAFAERYDPNVKNRRVYCLKRNKIEQDERYQVPAEGISVLPIEDFGSLAFYSPLTDENPRLISQAGLFTVSRNEHSVQDWVRTHYGGQTDWMLMQIDIDADAEGRAGLLRRLNQMNINHATLFPDIEGAARYAMMQLSIKHY